MILGPRTQAPHIDNQDGLWVWLDSLLDHHHIHDWKCSFDEVSPSTFGQILGVFHSCGWCDLWSFSYNFDPSNKYDYQISIFLIFHNQSIYLGNEFQLHEMTLGMLFELIIHLLEWAFVTYHLLCWSLVINTRLADLLQSLVTKDLMSSSLS